MKRQRPRKKEVYRDEGCDSFPFCLKCPLDACRYEDPTALIRWRNRDRDAQVADLTAQGLGQKEIALART